jgi:uncharacterized protein
MTERLRVPQEAERPFEGVTLKVVGNCNMGCPGCYMYVGGNESRRTKSSIMSEKVVAQTARRLKQYVTEYGGDIFVTFHGGEPLMLGCEGIKKRAAILKNTIPGEVKLRLQTNGLLLDEKMAKVLSEFDFRVGISLDGNRTANDRYRLDQSGRSTYDRTVRAIEVAKAEGLRLALLAVVDLQNNPLETYEELKKYDPREGMNFILPLANWNSPPPPGSGDSPTPYADWLIPVWDQWIAEPSPRSVKFFRSIMSLVLGGSTYSETLGNPPPDQVFISADGAYEDVDTLHSLGVAAPDLQRNVFEHSLRQVAEHPWMRFRRLGRKALSETCQDCSLVKVCGGGYIPHRFNAESSENYMGKFQNPSVYCRDLKRMIWHAVESIESYINAPPVVDFHDNSSM